jgi:hypothetical protein
VKSPKHLMLDRQLHPVSRLRDVCPWNGIWMMSTDIVTDTDEEAVGAEVRGATRCSWSTTTRVHAAPCASTAARPTRCTMRDCPRVPAESALADVPISQAESA